MTKYVFVTGGVVSGLGKGITAASLGALLKMRGLKVFVQKFDPYLNVDPGTMSPCQHGEVFVTDDGAETDLDLGHYERFIDESLNKLSTLTTGMIYSKLLDDERKGVFLGQTVQVVPHVTNEIKKNIYMATNTVEPDVQIIEIGGTVGDIESLPFIEAIRQVSLEKGRENVKYVHITLVPFLKASKEFKSKPTQHSVKTLMGMGIVPDFVVLRANEFIPEDMKEKIARLCSLKAQNIISAPDSDNIYQVPFNFHEQHFDDLLCDEFQMERSIDMKDWNRVLDNYQQLNKEITIALVGKYVELEDAYLSVKEALRHAGLVHHTKVMIDWIDSESLTEDVYQERLKHADGILVPGGFGTRGIEGKLLAAQYAREKQVPFLGICLGLQIAIIEFARHVAGLEDADSTEFKPNTKCPMIDYLPEQYAGIEMGGTMRLGAYDCEVKRGTLGYKIYKTTAITERHRHRYEFNNKYLEELEKHGLVFSGKNPQTGLVEMIELPKHPHYIAVQFHPEFKSRPTKAHPLFLSLIEASYNYKNNKNF